MEDLFDKDQTTNSSFTENKWVALTASPPWFEEQRASPSQQNSSDAKHADDTEELQALKEQAGEVARLFTILLLNTTYNREQLIQLRTFLNRSHKDLSALVQSFDKLAYIDECKSTLL